jgi:hypothetical protein
MSSNSLNFLGTDCFFPDFRADLRADLGADFRADFGAELGAKFGLILAVQLHQLCIEVQPKFP